EHDEIGALARRRLQGGPAVARDPGAVAGALEVARDDLRDRRLVVNDQHRAPNVIVHGGDCRSDHGRAGLGAVYFTGCSGLGGRQLPTSQNALAPDGSDVGDDESSVRLPPFTRKALTSAVPLSTTYSVRPSGLSRASNGDSPLAVGFLNGVLP